MVKKLNLIKIAEEAIENLIIDPGMLDILFNYIANVNIDLKPKQAAAVMLMRYVTDYWVNLF